MNRHIAYVMLAAIGMLSANARADDNFHLEILVPVHFEHLHPNVVDMYLGCDIAKVDGTQVVASGGGDGSGVYGKIVNGSYDGVLKYWIDVTKSEAAMFKSYSCNISMRFDDHKGGNFYSYINGTWWSKFEAGSASGKITGKF